MKFSFLDQRMCVPTRVVFKKLNLSRYLESEGKMGSTRYPHKKTVSLCVSLFQWYKLSVAFCLLYKKNHIHKARAFVYYIMIRDTYLF